MRCDEALKLFLSGDVKNYEIECCNIIPLFYCSILPTERESLEPSVEELQLFI